MSVVNFQQISEASARIKGYATRTPILTSRTLDAELGAEVFFKAEPFQRIGAFKFRGAFNAISQLSDEEKARGVITFSSGNHAQAVALVGKLLDVKTIVVMPNDASRTKLAATRGYGATVVEIDPLLTTREAKANELESEHGYTMIPPYNHKNVIAGQGTAALEMFEELGELDILMTPCGGGGLLSGSAVAAKAMSPQCKVIGIEPEYADDANRSFYSGELQSVSNPPTIADGVRTQHLGDLTFPLILANVDAMATVTEASIIQAVQYLFNRLKIVVEPSGVLGLASLMQGSVKARGRIGIILSGGNVDADVMARILATQF
ncbi:MAG: threo-3-hydroxy-L-aspartate ammonia-lyase [Candidatus Marinimicrobia bacterium]|nr:threo-3-hydroxy-L-aspartate ammonia-lyase [Candidatus Neomarinimicrobiota bacterium]